MSATGLARRLFGRRTRGASDEWRDRTWTAATVLTVGRAVLSGAILMVAIGTQSYGLLLAGIGVSMSLDAVDGFIARQLDRETVLGAQLDGIADRLAAALLVVGILQLEGGAAAAIAAAAVWLQFGVVDLLFSTQFLRFGLWSSDHFYALDRALAPGERCAERVWRLHWSVPAKLASNLPIALLAVGLWWPAVAVSLTLVAVRVPSYARVRELGERLPEPGHCRPAVAVQAGAAPARANPVVRMPAPAPAASTDPVSIR